MASRLPVRTMIVAVSSSVLLTLGTATAIAGPENPEFPLGNHRSTPQEQEKPEPDKKAEKAEKLGGGIVTKIIDMGAGIAKCGLNIVAPSVKCE